MDALKPPGPVKGTNIPPKSKMINPKLGYLKRARSPAIPTTAATKAIRILLEPQYAAAVLMNTTASIIPYWINFTLMEILRFIEKIFR
jgi:hypothetical protein